MHTLHNVFQNNNFNSEKMNSIAKSGNPQFKINEDSYSLKDFINAFNDQVSQTSLKLGSMSQKVVEIKENIESHVDRIIYVLQIGTKFNVLFRLKLNTNLFYMMETVGTIKTVDEKYWQNIENSKLKVNLLTIEATIGLNALKSNSNSLIHFASLINQENAPIPREHQNPHVNQRKMKINSIVTELASELIFETELDKKLKNRQLQVQKRNDYIVMCYESFCNQNKISTCWPLGDFFFIFLNWLDTQEFAVSTIKEWFSVLTKLNRKYDNTALDNYKFALRMRQITKKPTNKNSGKGKEPCTLADVKFMIDNMPMKYIHREYTASRMLFAVNSGARTISILSILIQNIVFVEKNAQGDLIRITVEINTLKGKTNQRHPVNFVRTNDESWLNEHLKNKYKIDLKDFENWKSLSNYDSLKTKKIWLCLKSRVNQSAPFLFH